MVPVAPIIACSLLLLLLLLLLLFSFTVDGVYYSKVDTNKRLINASLLTIYLLLHTRRSYGY